MSAQSLRGRFLETAVSVLGNLAEIAKVTDRKVGLADNKPLDFPVAWVRNGGDLRGRLGTSGTAQEVDAAGLVFLGAEEMEPPAFEDFCQRVVDHLLDSEASFRDAGIGIDDVRLADDPEQLFALPFETAVIRIEYGGIA